MTTAKESLFDDGQHVRDLAPNMPARELLQRLLDIADKDLADNQPAAGNLRGCALSLAARLDDAVKGLSYL